MHQRVLKIIVIAMGMLIVVGVAGLGYGFYQKSRDLAWTSFAPAAEATISATPAPAGPTFGTISLDLPKDCIIARINPDGDRIYLTIGPPGPCNRIVVIDVAGSRVLGTVQPQP